MGLFSRKKKPKESPDCTGRLMHIAFIMDGNGRWAKRRGMPRTFGHKQGAEAMRRLVRHCGDIGIKTATVYAFSTENWSRPKDEVDAIMRILENYVEEAFTLLDVENVRYVFLGDKSRLPETLRNRAEELERVSLDKPLTLNIALNYGARAEIVHACNELLSDGVTSITEDMLSSKLYTSHSPDPDLIVRTGGDIRISNFLLWQAAYAELCFTKTLWPDLSNDALDDIIRDFLSRSRRFGGLDPEKK